ncbi:MAG: hypothetical protein JST_000194 [Candidatus Parcubacteria bacterium]|nr:MAG: hypothetical protein JST_1760 [Candidatus Parcubacteria bacterium]
MFQRSDLAIIKKARLSLRIGLLAGLIAGSFLFAGNAFAIVDPLVYQKPANGTLTALEWNNLLLDFVAVRDGGRVGIGTETPGAKLEIYDSSFPRINFNRGGTVRGQIDIGTGFGGAPVQDFVISSPSNNLQFLTGNIIRLTILNNGNVGIGSTTPAQKLTVSGTGSFSQPVIVGVPLNDDHAATKNYVDSTATAAAGGGVGAGTSGQTLRHNGTSWVANSNLYNNGTNVGIGTTNPSEKLYVSGIIKATEGLGVANQFLSGGVYSYSNGILVNTDIAVSGNSMIELYIEGNSYSGWGAIGGKLGTHSGSNKITSIQNLAMPTEGVTNEVVLTPKTVINNSVGIGTAAPAYTLDISGTSRFTQPVLVGTPTAAGHATTKSYVDSTIGGGSGSTVGYWTMNGTNISNSNTGNVGIGTTTPSEKLDVVGSGNFSGTITSKNASIDGNYYALTNTFATFHHKNLTGAGQYALRQSVNGDTYLNAAANRSVWFNINNATKVIIDTNGNVGIGTTTPAAKLAVSGGNVLINDAVITSGTPKAAITKEYLDSSLSAAVSPITLWGGTASGSIWNLNEGNVGIGIENPTAPLHIIKTGGSTSDSNTALILDYESDLTTTIGGGTAIEFRGKSSGGNVANWQQARIRTVGYTGNNSHALAFDVRPSAVYPLTEAVRISSSGSVGIGTTAPAYKLDVSGTGSFSQPVIVGTPTATNHATTKSYVDSTATAAAGGGVGAGTSGQTLRHNGTSWVANSNLYNNGTNVGIGTTNPSEKLYVSGIIKATEGLGVANQFLSGGVYSYSNGILVNTDIAVSGNSMIELYIEGNSYSGWGAIGGKVTTYNYGSGGYFYNSSYVAHGITPAEVRVFHHDGFVKFWMPQTSSFQTYRFRLGTHSGSNKITSIQNLAMPTEGVTNEVVLTPKTVINNSVGIGTAAPAYTLDISGTSRFTQPVLVGTPTAAGHATTKSYVDSTIGGGSGSTVGYWTMNGTNISNSNTGNVGIGTTAPWGKLSVVGGDVSLTGSTNTRILVGDSLSNDDYGQLQWNTTGNFLSLESSGTSRPLALQQDGGNVGIGTTTPGYKLDVSGTGRFTQPVLVGTPTADGHATTKSYVDSTIGGGSGSTVGYWTMNGTNISNSNTGNVGVGTTNPATTLDIVSANANPLRIYRNSGNSSVQIQNNATSGYVGLNNSNNIALGFSLDQTSAPFQVTSTGNVGIGTAAPAYTLDISGTSRFTQPVLVGTPTAAGHATTKSYVDSTIGGGSGSTVGYWTMNGTNISNSNTGNVGIGTTTPSEKLDVVGSGNFSGTITSKNASIDGNYYALTNTFATFHHKNLTGAGQYALRQSVNGDTYLNAAANRSVWFNINNATKVIIDTNGNVGIGTTTPAAKLAVSGGNVLINDAVITSGTPKAAITKEYLDSSLSAAVSPITLWGGTASGSIWNLNEGNVGIGIENPTAPLHIIKTGGSTSDSNTALILDYESDLTTTIGGGTAIEFRGKSSGGNVANWQQARIRTVGYTGNNSHALAFDVRPSAVYPLTEAVRISSSGSVGIGTTAPAYKLDVSGTGSFSQPVIVGTPTATNHATTKSYVDSTATAAAGGGVGAGTSGQTLRHNGTSWVANSNLYNNGTNVGIGTTNPSEKLYVSGIIKATEGLGVANQFLSGGVYSYSNGILVNTDIAVSGNSMIELYIEGNSYSGWGAIGGKVTTYNYGSGGYFYNSSYVAHGITPAEVRVFHHDGFVKFWMPQTSSFQTYRFRLGTHSGSNKITSIQNLAMPTEGVTNEVVLTPKTVINNSVGIGTAAPAYTLDISGTSRFTQPVLVGTPTAAGHATTKSYVDSTIGGGSGSTVGYWTMNGTNISNSNTGNVGIGTTAPWGKLSVVGGDVSLTGSTNTRILVGDSLSNDDYGQLQWNTTGNFLSLESSGTSRPLALQQDGGNVGIGTTTPGYKLDVSGTGRFTQPVLVGTPTADGHATTKSYVDSTIGGGSGSTVGYWTMNGTNISNSNTGNVGVGTTNPATTLDIVSANANPLRIYRNSGNSSVQIQNNATSGYVGLNNSNNIALGFSLDQTSAPFQVTSTGNVGIGTAAPAYTLDISGTSRFTQPVLVGTPTAADHATTKSYVDSAAGGGIPAAANGSTLRASGTSWVASTNLYNDGSQIGIGTDKPGSLLTLANDGWLSARSGGDMSIVNMFKVNTNNQIEVGAPLLIGPLEFAPDSGLVSLVDMPVTSASPVGTPQGYVMKIDGNNLLSLYSESNGSGGAQNMRLGVNTATPAYSLDVAGTGRFTQPLIVGTPTAADHATTKSYVDSAIGGGSGSTVGYWTLNGTNLYTSSTDFKVGIGTATPNTKLSVLGNDDSGGLGVLELLTTGGTSLRMGGNTTYSWIQSHSSKPLYINQLGNNTIINPGGGNVGIGTAAPGAKLQLGDSSGTNIKYSLGAATTQYYWGSAERIGISIDTNNAWSLGATTAGAGGIRLGNGANYSYLAGAGTNLLLNPTVGSVGIGTGSPAYKLDVAGTGRFTQPVIVGTPTAADHATTKSYVDSTATAAAGGGVGAGTSGQTLRHNGTSWVANSVLYNNGTNVGIGTASPSQKLSVESAGAQLRVRAVGSVGTSTVETVRLVIGTNIDGSFPNTAGNRLSFATRWTDSTEFTTAAVESHHDNSWGGGLSFLTKPDDGNPSGEMLTRMVINHLGNVGIGTTAPAYNLDVAGTSRFTQPVIVGTPTATNHATTKSYVDSTATAAAGGGVGVGTSGQTLRHNGTSWVANSNLYNNGTNVGVGTTVPGANLHVADAVVSNKHIDTQASQIVEDTEGRFQFIASNSGTGGSGFTFTNAPASGNNTHWNINHVGSSIGDGLLFRYSQTTATGQDSYVASGFVNSLYLKENGNVGIGTTAPAYKLDVSGTGSFSQPVIVGTPTATNHATTKSYVDSTATAAAGGGVGAGTSGQTLRHNGTSWVANSNLYNNGTNVGIGTTNPSEKLYVSGIIKATEGLGVANQFLSGGVYSYSNGILVNTDIAVSGNSMIELYIEGNSYSGWGAIGGKVTTYNYGSGGYFYNSSYVAHGITPAEVRVFHHDGFVKFWMPQTSSFQTYRFRLGTHSGSNKITSIQNLAMPTEGVTNEVVLTPKTVINNSVGIGTAAPAYTLDISGTSRFTQPVIVGTPTLAGHATTKSYVDSAVSGGSGSTVGYWALNGTSLYASSTTLNVGIGTTNPGTYKLNVAGSAYISGGLSLGASNLTTTGTVSANKITVGTIDPLYNLKGVNYSTFAASIVGGVKEETTGRVMIDQAADGEYQKTLDFKRQTVGSDLWVWYNVVDFSKDNLEVLLTPYGKPANVYYTVSGEKLTLHSNVPVEVSYRLIAKRFDWKDWPTKAKDQAETPNFILK